MRYMSGTEERYQAGLAVIGEGRTVSDVALQLRVDRRTVHPWLARYEAGGPEGLGDRSPPPVRWPHQMPAAVAAWVTSCSRRWREPAPARYATSAQAAPRGGHIRAPRGTHQPEVSRDRSAGTIPGHQKDAA